MLWSTFRLRARRESPRQRRQPRTPHNPQRVRPVGLENRELSSLRNSATPASYMVDQHQDTQARKDNGFSCAEACNLSLNQPNKPKNGDGYWHIRTRDPASLHLQK